MGGFFLVFAQKSAGSRREPTHEAEPVREGTASGFSIVFGDVCRAQPLRRSLSGRRACQMGLGLSPAYLRCFTLENAASLEEASAYVVRRHVRKMRAGAAGSAAAHDQLGRRPKKSASVA